MKINPYAVPKQFRASPDKVPKQFLKQTEQGPKQFRKHSEKVQTCLLVVGCCTVVQHDNDDFTQA